MKQYLHATGCPCGKDHTAQVKAVVTGSGVVEQVPELLAQLGGKYPFLLSDANTWQAAGQRVAQLLAEKGIAYGSYVYPGKSLEPDEQAVGSAIMHYDHRCDTIVGVGSGVINDIGKILSATTGHPYMIIATAPSMDGYASATSSMAMDGVKVSLNSRCADVIVGDTDILRQAPEHMLKAGLGDMLAKYVSIAEWRIAHIITGEYYCPEVAELIRKAVKKCADNAKGLMQRKPEAVEAVFEGLVIGGLAMAYAGVSRPASGVEHYFSHVWDMRALEFGGETHLHGIQCALATVMAVKLYHILMEKQPDWERANAYVQGFDYDSWSKELIAFVGSSAQTMIELEVKEGKYRKDTHKQRFQIIQTHWQEILEILRQELPPAGALEDILDTIELDGDAASIGVDRACLQQTFRATKDIRDKYVLSRLAWDLGLLEELCQSL